MNQRVDSRFLLLAVELSFCVLLSWQELSQDSFCRFDLSGIHLKASGFQDPDDEKSKSEESTL